MIVAEPKQSKLFVDNRQRHSTLIVKYSDFFYNNFTISPKRQYSIRAEGQWSLTILALTVNRELFVAWTTNRALRWCNEY